MKERKKKTKKNPNKMHGFKNRNINKKITNMVRQIKAYEGGSGFKCKYVHPKIYL